VGWHAPVLTTPALRLQGAAFWDVMTFVVNSVLFALVGLQLPRLVEALGDVPAREVAWAAVAVSVAVVLIRVVWVFAFMFGPYVRGWLGGRYPRAKWRTVAVVSWAGMRGAVSLAAALAIPLDVPQRDLLIFLAFVVILVTLVGQGLTLPALIRVLDLPDDGSAAREDANARVFAAEAAVARLDELEREEWVREDTAERMRGLYSYRRNRFASRFEGDPEGVEERSAAYQHLMVELLGAQRLRLITMRDEGSIGDEVMHRIERDLDLEESRLEL
jgi:CPA1 family monovalent cation:H+ antiporter